MKQVFTACLCLLSIYGVAPAQENWMPDSQLRKAIREHLEIPINVPLTKKHLLMLESFEAQNVGIRDIKGLEFAENLVNLNIGSNQVEDILPLRNLVKLQGLSLYANQVSNLSPLESLTSLVYLNVAHNPITDLSPLSNHTNLETLDLFDCQISDVSPLTGLKNLKNLILTYNRINDFSPLANLTNLQRLYIKGNLANDISSLQNLPLTEFEYDAVCEIASLETSIISRIQARDYPSVFQAWDDLIGFEKTRKNAEPWNDEVLYTERLTKHDLHWSPFFGLWWKISETEPTYGLSTQLGGELEEAKAIRQQRLTLNPNMLFLVEVRIHNHLQTSAFPPDSEFWLRDRNNRIIANNYSENPMDLLNRDLQSLLIERIVAVAKCGLFDGVMIDGFNSNATGFVDRHFHSATDEDIIAATTRILREVRTRVRDDFLILVNANRTKPTAYAEYVNGTFMETGHDSNGSYTREGLQEIEDTLMWAETQLREPQINCLEGEGVGTSPPNSPENQRWMRVFTTLSLTHSNGYVLYTDGMRFVDPQAAHHAHIWYDFWDADLGQPIGEKAQLYENREGLFIREFTHGWAVYNRSGAPQAIQLPEQATGVESGLRNTTHTLPDLDGEIYLKSTTDTHDVNADGIVNILDLVAVANGFGKNAPDVNGDGVVNVLDLVQVANRFGQ